MVCLGLEPGASGWKVQMNPLSYHGTLTKVYVCVYSFIYQATFYRREMYYTVCLGIIQTQCIRVEGLHVDLDFSVTCQCWLNFVLGFGSRQML